MNCSYWKHNQNTTIHTMQTTVYQSLLFPTDIEIWQWLTLTPPSGFESEGCSVGTARRLLRYLHIIFNFSRYCDKIYQLTNGVFKFQKMHLSKNPDTYKPPKLNTKLKHRALTFLLAGPERLGGGCFAVLWGPRRPLRCHQLLLHLRWSGRCGGCGWL